MTQLTMNHAWCEALFASGLQRSDASAPEALVRQPAAAAGSGRATQPTTGSVHRAARHFRF